MAPATPTQRLATFAVAALAAFGCGGAPVTPTPPAPPLATIIGPHVAAPEPLARVRPGMTVAELVAAVPGATPVKEPRLISTRYRLPFAAAVELHALVEGDHVEGLEMFVPGADARARLVAAWGALDAEPDRVFQDPEWRSIESGWRGRLNCSDPTEPPGCLVELHRHVPLEAMFTPAVSPPPPFDKLHIDMPATDARAQTGLPYVHGALFPKLDYDGASADVEASHERISQIGVIVPITTRDLITRSWGPPQTTVDKYAVWIDTKTEWSAYVDDFGSDELKIDYANVAAVTAVVDALLAMTGRSVDQLRADHPELTDHDYISMPVIDVVAEPGHYETFVLVEDSRGTAAFSVVLDARHMVPGGPDTVHSELAERYGKPKSSRNKDGNTVLDYSPHVSLGANTTGSFIIHVH